MADERDPARKAAIERLKAKRGFQQNLVSYVAINALLVAIWFIGGRGFFWPVFPIVFWGFAVAMHAWSVYGQKPITEDDVRREMEKGGGGGIVE